MTQPEMTIDEALDATMQQVDEIAETYSTMTLEELRVAVGALANAIKLLTLADEDDDAE